MSSFQPYVMSWADISEDKLPLFNTNFKEIMSGCWHHLIMFKIQEKPQIMYKIAKILQLPPRGAPLTPGPQVVTPPPPSVIH